MAFYKYSQCTKYIVYVILKRNKVTFMNNID